MPTDSGIEVHAAELAQIVEAVFDTMLQLDVTQCDVPWRPDDARLMSFVHLTGDWNGAVLIECSQIQACRFAARFLSIDPVDTVDDVVRDVLGELANMIVGNVKSVLSPNLQLSMPSVVAASNHYSLHICGAEVRDRLTFRCSEGIFWVTVMSRR